MNNSLMISYHINQLSTPEMSRVILICGAIFSTIYKNEFNVIPGGIVVPGFLVITFLLSPLWSITLITQAIIIYFFYKKFLMRVYFRRRTPVYILGLVSIILGSLVSYLFIYWKILPEGIDSLLGIFIPALIASTCLQQRPTLVIRGIILSTIATAITTLSIYFLFSTIFGDNFSVLTYVVEGKERIFIRYSLLQFSSALIISYCLYCWKGIRSGGYLAAPYVASLLSSPLSILLFFIGYLSITWLVTWICQQTLTVGLDRYSIALCLSTLYIWLVELLFIWFGTDLLPFRGSYLFVIIALLSYVNDSIIYKEKKVFVYIFLSLFFSFILSLLLETVYWMTV